MTRRAVPPPGVPWPDPNAPTQPVPARKLAAKTKEME